MAMTFVLAAGCTADPRTDTATSRSIRTDVVLTVENEESRPFLIFLRSDAWVDSLGQIRGHATRSFSVPSRASDSAVALRLEARDRRNPSIGRSHPLTLSSGHQVVWKLHRERGSELTLK